MCIIINLKTIDYFGGKMRNRNIIMTIIIISLFIFLTACNSNDSKETIQLWWYDELYSDLHTRAVTTIINKVSLYCKNNNIPLEVVKYNSKTLPYDDYVLKRNTAMAGGNMIVISDVGLLHDIADQHADYSKVQNYTKLLDIYKNRFCIPMGVGYRTMAIRNDILNYYDISTERNIITTEDYLHIKQQMKEKGAIFRPNQYEYNEIINYYLIKNGLKYLNGDSEIISNNKMLKEAIKKTTIDVYEDIKLYGKDIKSFDFISEKKVKDNIIFDESSRLDFGISQYLYMLTYYDAYTLLNDEILDTTFVLNDYHATTPNIFLYKKVTNEKIYDVINEMLDESYYKLVSDHMEHAYSPVFNTEAIREILDVDDNWEYNGLLKGGAENGVARNVKIVNLINEIYDLTIKNKEKSEEIANNYFSNPSYHFLFQRQVSSLVQTLIVDDLDYSKPEVDEMINESIDEFITNFNVHFN